MTNITLRATQYLYHNIYKIIFTPQNLPCNFLTTKFTKQHKSYIIISIAQYLQYNIYTTTFAIQYLQHSIYTRKFTTQSQLQTSYNILSTAKHLQYNIYTTTFSIQYLQHNIYTEINRSTINYMLKTQKWPVSNNKL